LKQTRQNKGLIEQHPSNFSHLNAASEDEVFEKDQEDNIESDTNNILSPDSLTSTFNAFLDSNDPNSLKDTLLNETREPETRLSFYNVLDDSKKLNILSVLAKNDRFFREIQCSYYVCGETNFFVLRKRPEISSVTGSDVVEIAPMDSLEEKSGLASVLRMPASISNTNVVTVPNSYQGS